MTVVGAVIGNGVAEVANEVFYRAIVITGVEIFNRIMRLHEIYHNVKYAFDANSW